MTARVLLSALLLACLCTVPAGQAAARPNVIFILIDDLGLGDVERFGHPYLKTPNINRLADEGTWFEEFYVNSPVCTPTRAAFMTGRYPSRFRIHGHFSTHENNVARGMPDYLDPATPTIATILRNAGYATAHFGKWHLGEIGAPDPGAYGFESHRTTQSSGLGWPDENAPDFRSRSTDLMVNETINFINNAVARGRNFYVNFWTLAPHAPLAPSPAEMAVYQNLQVNPWDFQGHMVDYIRMAPDMLAQMRTYLAAVTGMDQAIGRLLDYLDTTGLAENTIILFASDNGPEDYHIPNARNAGMGYTGQYRGRKRSLYEGGIRSPMFIRWPKRIKAGYIDTFSIISGVDILPTLCAMTGTPLPPVALDGTDLSESIYNNTPLYRTTPIYWEWRYSVAGPDWNRSPRFAVRSGEWKLLSDGEGGGTELYQLTWDPEERVNRALDYPELAAQLEALLAQWRGTLP